MSDEVNSDSRITGASTSGLVLACVNYSDFQQALGMKYCERQGDETFWKCPTCDKRVAAKRRELQSHLSACTKNKFHKCKLLKLDVAPTSIQRRQPRALAPPRENSVVRTMGRITKDTVKKFQKGIAESFLSCNWPFRSVENPSVRRMFENIPCTCGAVTTLLESIPRRTQLTSTLANDHVNDAKAKVDEILSRSWAHETQESRNPPSLISPLLWIHGKM